MSFYFSLIYVKLVMDKGYRGKKSVCHIDISRKTMLRPMSGSTLF